MTPTRSLLCAVLLLLGPVAAVAHEVETVDGTVYEGRIVLEGEEEVVIVTTFDGRVTIPQDQVKRIDRSTPPLREQFEFRALQAKDSVPDLLKLHKWAKTRGFDRELVAILVRIVELDPTNAKARRLLGHEKVGGVWMSPEEKEAHLERAYAEEMRAKGLVQYLGRWVTPEERDALQRGLMRDGDQWVTEEEYHRRRGEKWIDGAWVKVGEKEGQAWLETLRAGRVTVRYRWGPNVDLYHDTDDEAAAEGVSACEKVFQAFWQTVQPANDSEYPAGVSGRVRVHLFAKQPPYARFVRFFDQHEKCSELVRGWAGRAQRQHAFWWVQPSGVVGVYKFPNTTRTVVSNAAHSLAFILLTRYRFNYRFPRAWLLEGFAYHLELEAYGYSDTFNVHRAGTAAAAASGAPAWIDSGKWKGALRAVVDQGQDPPLARIVRMEADQLGYVELVKSWSVVDFLVRVDPEKFRAFLVADKDREKTHDEALAEAYGWTWRELDQQWRAHVQKEYEALLAPSTEE